MAIADQGKRRCSNPRVAAACDTGDAVIASKRVPISLADGFPTEPAVSDTLGVVSGKLRPIVIGAAGLVRARRAPFRNEGEEGFRPGVLEQSSTGFSAAPGEQAAGGA